MLDLWRTRSNPRLHPAVDTAAFMDHQSLSASLIWPMDFWAEECDAALCKNRPSNAITSSDIPTLTAAKPKVPPHAVWVKQ